MPARTSHPPRQDVRGGVLRELDISAARALTVFATVGTASAAAILFLFQGIPAGHRGMMQALLLAATIAQLVLYRVAGRSRPRLVLAVVLVSNSTVMALLHLLMGVGVQGLGMGLSTLFIALGGMLIGARAAAGLALLNLLYVAGLYLAEMQGLIPGRALTAAQPSLNRVVALSMMIGAGVLAAMVLLRQYQQAFEEASLQRERLDGLLRIGTDWVWEQDAEGRFTHLSETFAERSGLDPARFLGRRLWELPDARLQDDERARLREHYARREPLRDEVLRLQTADGQQRLIAFTAEPAFGGTGKFGGWRGVGHDITRLVAESQRRRDSERLLLRIFRTAPDAISLNRMSDGVFLRVNRRLLELLGREEAELLGHSAVELGVWCDPADRARMAAQLQVQREIQNWPSRLRRRDGSEFPALMSTALLTIGGQEMMIAMTRDVSEQAREREQLDAAKRQAEAASQAKSTFLATMSHEMRTPLNGTLGMIALARTECDPARRDEFLRHAEASGRALSQIISDILDLARVEAGRLQLEHADFDLHALARSVHAVHEPQARDKGLAFTLDIAPGVPCHVTGDAMRVRQVMVNFVGNALKFTERGQVTLRLQPLEKASEPGAGVRISVHDTGVGIPADVLPQLFRPFVQADATTTRRFGGTGLGLSICRELAQLMGGRVGVRSAQGAGSEFWADLPLAPAAAAAADDRPAAGESQPLRGARVLVAEDHPVNMMIAVEMLRRWGAEVDETGDGEQAIACVAAAQAEGRPYAAVLMDMHMPTLGGVDATRRLRERHDARQLPIIALTAAALASEQRQAIEAGMNDFVTKPFDANHLLAVLQRACNRTVPSAAPRG